MYLSILGLDEPLGGRTYKEAISALYSEDIGGWIALAQPLEREADIKRCCGIIQRDLDVTGKHYLLKSATLNSIYDVCHHSHPGGGWLRFDDRGLAGWFRLRYQRGKFYSGL